MPKTASNPIVLGAPARDFQLPDADGLIRELSDYAAAPALPVAFISNRCPFVVGIREALAELARRDAPDELQVIAINSNDAVARPEETPKRNGAEVETRGCVFPSLREENWSVARACGAVRMPDLHLFDASRRPVCHGQFDGFRPGNDVPPTGEDLQRAVDGLQHKVARRSGLRSSSRRGRVKPSSMSLLVRAGFLGLYRQTMGGPRS